MSDRKAEMKKVWDDSFEAQIEDQAYNTAPAEALIRTAAYYMRDKFSQSEWKDMHVMEMGCGAGPNLIWAAKKGCQVSGIDISPTILPVCRKKMEEAGVANRIGELVEGSVTDTPFADNSFDVILESCVFQHLNKEERQAAFNEVKRVLKPGGAFVGYMLDRGHTTYLEKKSEELSDDPGTIMLKDNKSGYYLTNIGLAHFFSKEEYFDLLDGCSVIDPCLNTYYLPEYEAKKRGYKEYMQSMWNVYAVK